VTIRCRVELLRDRPGGGLVSGPLTLTILSQEVHLAKGKLASHRVEYTKEDVRQLKALIKAKTPIAEIGKAMGRTAAGVRMKARTLGIMRSRAKK
jgi:hypothetical protein